MAKLFCPGCIWSRKPPSFFFSTWIFLFEAITLVVETHSPWKKEVVYTMKEVGGIVETTTTKIPFFFFFPEVVFTVRALDDSVIWFKVELPLCLAVRKKKIKNKKSVQSCIIGFLIYFDIGYFLVLTLVISFYVHFGQSYFSQTLSKSHSHHFSTVFFMFFSSKTWE